MSNSSATIRADLVDSTMSRCRILVESGVMVSGQAIVASHQSGGRGRAERVWIDIPGAALLMTAFNEVTIGPERLGLLSILAGVVLTDVLRDMEVDARIKWPNDVIVEDRKLAGIVIVTTPAGEGHRVYAGFGVNVLAAPGELVEVATCVAAESTHEVTVEALGDAVLAAWNRELSQFTATNPAAIVDRWHGSAGWIGQTVTVLGDRETTGTLRGIDQQGRLELDVGGYLQVFASGDVTRGPRLTH